MSRQARNLFLLLLFATTATFAQACSLHPKAYDITAYWSAQAPEQVVFQARVRTVVTEDVESGGQTFKRQRIEFRPIRWWRGGSGHDIVTGTGHFGGSQGSTSCAGVFDFAVNEGDDWLIVGHLSNGVIQPSRLLSKKLVDGNPPEAYLGVFESAIAHVRDSGVIAWKVQQDEHGREYRQQRLMPNTLGVPIAASVGDALSVRFQLEASDKKNEKLRLKSIFIFPRPIAYPGRKAPQTRYERTNDWKAGAVQWDRFVFDDERKLVAGTWTWELWDGTTMIASTYFRLAQPD